MPPVRLCSGLACTYQMPRVSFYVETKNEEIFFVLHNGRHLTPTQPNNDVAALRGVPLLTNVS